MAENPTTILVELYAEQAQNGASAEKLAMTMDRITRSSNAGTTVVSVSADESLKGKATAAVDLQIAIAKERRRRGLIF